MNEISPPNIVKIINGENWIQMKSTTTTTKTTAPTTTTIQTSTTTTTIFRNSEHWKTEQDMHEYELYQNYQCMTNECWTVNEKSSATRVTERAKQSEITNRQKEWDTKSIATTNVTNKICILCVLFFFIFCCCCFPFGFVLHSNIKTSVLCMC